MAKDDLVTTNKERQPSQIEGAVGENAKAIEEMLQRIDWKRIGYGYAIGFAVLLASLFFLIVTVKLALSIF